MTCRGPRRKISNKSHRTDWKEPHDAISCTWNILDKRHWYVYLVPCYGLVNTVCLLTKWRGSSWFCYFRDIQLPLSSQRFNSLWGFIYLKFHKCICNLFVFMIILPSTLTSDTSVCTNRNLFLMLNISCIFKGLQTRKAFQARFVIVWLITLKDDLLL